MRTRLTARQQATVYLTIQGAFNFLLTLALTMEVIYHAESVRLDPLRLVMVGVVVELATFVFEVPTGIVADRYGRRLSVIVGTATLGIAFALEGLLPRYEAVLLAAALWGFGMTFISGALSAWIADEIGTERAAPLYLRGTQVATVSSALAIAVSAWLASRSLSLPLVVSGAGFLMLTVYELLVMQERNYQPVQVRATGWARQMTEPLRAIADGLQLRRVLVLILLIGGARGLFVSGYERLWQPFLLALGDFPEMGVWQVEPVVWIGGIVLIRQLLTIGALEGVRRRFRLEDHRQAAWLIGGLYGLMVASGAGFALAGGLLLAAVMFWINQTALAVCRPVFMAWINQHAEAQTRATMISLYWQSIAIANIVSGPVTGWIASRYSLRLALLLAAGAMLVFVPLVSASLRYDDSPKAML